ncbi:hypothetical protein [Clostridium saccharoperbutylacetonicum]|uniref:hypothetical protein n=1 Tax=Clostridium saccharoperbutylacetonicum TaxID=36745 RepID=UPI0039E868F0
MIKSKFVKTLVASLLTVGVIAGYAGTSAYAKNNSDTGWSFSVFGDEGTQYTDSREKQDNSKAYCKINNYNGKDDDYLQMYLVDGNKHKFSKTPVKTVTGTGEYSITNYAYEDRKKTPVRIAFYAPYRNFYTWSASGVWSPDSSGSYN